MDKVRMALVGCGGMGTRHLHGLAQLVGTAFDSIDLVAVCDINRDNAAMAAAEAERLLGRRPEVFADLAAMAAAVPALEAVDVVTDPSVHHTVCCQALDLGWHVLVEKPLAITAPSARPIWGSTILWGRAMRSSLRRGGTAASWAALFSTWRSTSPI